MKFVKIIYFNESFVADFMQIIAGGEIKKTTEFISNVSADVQGEANTSAETAYRRDKVVKNILENTLLSDFMELIKNDAKRKPDNQRCKSISVFPQLKVYPEPNFFHFLCLQHHFFRC